MKRIYINLCKTSMIAFFLLIFFTNNVQATPIYTPEIIASNAITIDMTTNEIIYAKGADIQVQPASTTKLITALLLAENKSKSDSIIYTELASIQPSSSIFIDKLPLLKIGDTISADNVMKGLLLHSGNDMACMIAENISSNVDEFSKLMNIKAKSIGMNNTNFYTPSGLDSDRVLNGNKHYTTAYDLALLGISAFNNPWVRYTMSLKDNIDFFTNSGLNTLINNGNRNLNKQGCIGGKTGYTIKAGRCFVAIYERNHRKIVGVVLGSTYPEFFSDMESIIDYSYSVNPYTIYKAGEEVSSKMVSFKTFKFFGPKKQYKVPFITDKDVNTYINEINSSESTISVNINNIDIWNLSKDTPIGTLNLTERNSIKIYNLYPSISTEDFINYNYNNYIKLILVMISILSFIVIILLILIIKKHNEKLYKN